ncbi:MAG TPA: radical SAM protein [Malonomonas sp.]
MVKQKKAFLRNRYPLAKSLNLNPPQAILPHMRTLLTTLHSKYIHASLALPCLAAFCAEDCGELLIREYTVHEPKESLLAQIVDCDADVVAFSVYLWNRLATLELVVCLKLVNPELKIVLGGPEISFEDDDFFARHPVDALICGEGELPLRQLLRAWQVGAEPQPFSGLRTKLQPQPNGQSLLENLDQLPSPFAAGLVDLTRGLVYYESSRGCPYDCSFCMSALDEQVRSFSQERIFTDLKLLMDRQVKQIKFVDRTFNYHNQRSREIFRFILQHNRSSHFHFEIGAHLLDAETLQLLETVPEGMFQFEIGVQSTLPETLAKVGRSASLAKLAENVHRLRSFGNIHLHLDLIAGLPGESFSQFLTSLDWTAALQPHHLQIEPVKVLPGAPLREQSAALGLRFDPNPPYAILHSTDLDYAELERLRGIGRLLDLLVNSGRFKFLLPALTAHFSSLSATLDSLDRYWRSADLYRGTRSLRELYWIVDGYLKQVFSGQKLTRMRELLGRDFAHNERVVGGSAPDFFDVNLNAEEAEQVRRQVKQVTAEEPRSGKVQYFAALYHHLEDLPGRRVVIFLYLTRSAQGLEVRELLLEE